MCIYIHQRIGRGIFVAAHSHHEGRSPPGRWSWKGETRITNFFFLLAVIIFSVSLSRFLSLSPRIEAYVEEIDSPEERRGGATRRSLNPGKERASEHERRGRLPLSRGPGTERRQRRAALRRKGRPLQRNRPPPPRPHVWKVGRFRKTTTADVTGGKTHSVKCKESNIYKRICVIARAHGSHMTQGSNYTVCIHCI